MSEDDYPPLSALNDLLFCPRRCALHRLEGIWHDTAHTLEGTHAHRRVHADPSHDEESGSVRIVRGLWLRSDRLRLVGVTDVVEFRPNPNGGPDVPYPVEYKRGRRRRWDNDEVQLCAQALCLEETLGVAVPEGAIYNVRSRRRREVQFDEQLRELTVQSAQRLHVLLASGLVPPPVLHPKCRKCSLYETCMPELISDQSRCNRAARALFVVGQQDVES